VCASRPCAPVFPVTTADAGSSVTPSSSPSLTLLLFSGKCETWHQPAPRTPATGRARLHATRFGGPSRLRWHVGAVNGNRLRPPAINEVRSSAEDAEERDEQCHPSSIASFAPAKADSCAS